VAEEASQYLPEDVTFDNYAQAEWFGDLLLKKEYSSF
jgi:hypothetical protein